tara:strand:- start:7658 stop:7798 length:141 start_codon:yes stop_codon:yes gene_type:complete
MKILINNKKILLLERRGWYKAFDCETGEEIDFKELGKTLEDYAKTN